MDPDVKDVLLVSVPAGFTLGGTVIGSLLNQRGAGTERRRTEDAEARAAVVALGAPFPGVKAELQEQIREGRGGMYPEEARQQLWDDRFPAAQSELRDRIGAAQSALTLAGVPWRVIDPLMQVVRKVVNLDPRLIQGEPVLEDASRIVVLRDLAVVDLVIEFMLNLLDESRAKRRSSRTKRRAVWRASELATGKAPDLVEDSRLASPVVLPTITRSGWRSFLRRRR